MLFLYKLYKIFVFCLSGSCTGVIKDPKSVTFLASICNFSLSCLYLFNERRFRQVPGSVTDTLHGIFNPPLTRGHLR